MGKISQRIVKDCIYRFIEIPKLCEIFLDQPEVQRMRRIRQVGVASYVFPSATHTRFEHSLGVMYLAGVMIDNLRKYTKISDRDKELVQLAGLLHDVGHLAFSHLFDDVLEIKGYNGLEYTHEYRSTEILKRMNEKLQILTPAEENKVSYMILGKIPPDAKDIFLYQIVNNAECGLDVDKMDYLQRDAYHTGLPGFQSDYIILNTILNSEGRISFAKKTKNEIKELFLTREKMFTTVYHHRTVIKFERLYTCAFMALTLDMNIEKFLKYDDYWVESAFREQIPELMKEVDCRRLNHTCERCSNITFKRISSTVKNIDTDPLKSVRLIE